jgi:DNA-binding MarR family transcriptional regulator
MNRNPQRLSRQPSWCDHVEVDVPWLTDDELAAWVRLIGVVELLPGVLDAQLRRDAGLSHFEYHVLAMLSESPQHTLRMTALAARTNATLPRLSHVVRRLEERGLIERSACPQDARATNARLTDEGWDTLRAAAPGHVATVREHVIDALTPEQVDQLGAISEAILGRVDPNGALRPRG